MRLFGFLLALCERKKQCLCLSRNFTHSLEASGEKFGKMSTYWALVLILYRTVLVAFDAYLLIGHLLRKQLNLALNVINLLTTLKS